MLTRCSAWINDSLVAPGDQIHKNGTLGTLLVGGGKGSSYNVSFIGVSQITNQN